MSIGNSDDKLTQAEWNAFIVKVMDALFHGGGRFHGEWFSLPSAPFQNACFCVQIERSYVPHLQQALTEIRRQYRQDSIAWAQASTTFI